MIVLRLCAVRHTFQLCIGFTAGRPPLLSVLAAALHLPIVGTWRTRKALGVPYGIAYRRWERKRSQIAKKNTANGLVRRGRPLTSQTAFGGQLPYKGSLVRPVARFHHSLFEYNGRFLRATSHEQRATIVATSRGLLKAAGGAVGFPLDKLEEKKLDKACLNL